MQILRKTLANGLCIVAIAVLFVGLAPLGVDATSDSPWLSTTYPTIAGGEVASVPYHISNNGRECMEDSKFVTRPKRISQAEISHTACAVYTNYGKVDPNGYIELNNTKVAGRVQTSAGLNSTLLPVPASNTALQSTGSGNYRIHANLPQSFSGITTSSNGEVKYKLAPVESAPLIADANGNVLKVYYSTVSFSANGKWMLFDSPAYHLPGGIDSFIRYNLETHEALPFQESPTYSSGFSPNVKSALSNDGRYAILYSNTTDLKRVYDLETCGVVPATITDPVACESRILDLSQGIPNVQSAINIKFITNNVVSFYANYKDSNQVTHTGKYRMVAPGQTATNLDYLGLGDSFSSGEGAFSYYEGTDTDENKCHLSTVSYPYLIGDALNLNSYESVACSGAIVKNVTTGLAQYGEPDPNPLGEWLPGVSAQLGFVKAYEPSKATITMGGNDIGFADIIQKCTWTGTCYETYEDRFELVNEINTKFDKLASMYTSIKTAMAANGKVYIVGYPHLAKEDGDCALNVWLDQAEIEYSNLLIDYLNDVIEAAAEKAGVRYVDVSDAMNGHRLCETDNVAVNGLTAGNDIFDFVFIQGPLGNESYHPNPMGNRLLKSKILTQTNDLTQAMPAANSAAAPPVIAPSLPILDAPTTSRVTRSTSFYDSFAPDAVIKGATNLVTIDGLAQSLKKNSLYELWLHSDPIQLGSASTDSNGDLDAEFVIPSTVPAGFHTLHVYGQNLTGDTVDMYKTIFVAETSSDYDGDTVLNDADPCPTIAQSGVDDDQDGVDDACDNYINDSPDDIDNLYRARSGDNGAGEDPNSIYVERNVALANVMLGVNDYDQDSDGWVLVGKTDSATDGTIANFWVEDTGPRESILDKYLPRVAIRSMEDGCLQFGPADLSPVTDSSARAVTVQGENTSTCRSEAPSDDVDNDSVPDNEQIIYRARNGDTNKGEDTSKLYIERSIVASEAILGISDYDADSDGWAVIGITDVLTATTYNSIALIDSDGETVLSSGGTFTAGMLLLSTEQRRSVVPLVLADTSSDCIGFRPELLTYVAASQVRATTSMTLPSGLSCQ